MFFIADLSNREIYMKKFVARNATFFIEIPAIMQALKGDALPDIAMLC